MMMSRTHAGEVIPRSCIALRKKYERACPSSWVKHFDDIRKQKKRIDAIMRQSQTEDK